MAFMKSDTTLRDAPNGNVTAIVANWHDLVEVLGTQQGWIKIKDLSYQDEPEGWVPATTVNLAGDPPAPELTPEAFAVQCWWEYLFNDANPHYVVAAAKLRQQILGGVDQDNLGPFRLTHAEWDAMRSNPELKLQAFTPGDIADWRRQCLAFARMVQYTQAKLKDALAQIQENREPTCAELFLAQMIGPVATVEGIGAPDKTVKAILDAVNANDLPPGGLNADQLIERYAKLLRIKGPSAAPAKAQEALEQVAAALQTALDKVKQTVIDAGREVLGNQPTEEVVDADDPLQSPNMPQNIPNVPGGQPEKVSGAGGILGELIAKAESGGDYTVFNRGGAGDSTGHHINFGAMTLSQIMTLQSLPPGNANRLFAVGKYQLIPKTLRSTAKALKLGNVNFEPKVQERCFRHYLVAGKRPQVKNYIIGASNDLEGAQYALAFEFAAVARPDTGRSHYGGMAGNAASITAGRTKMALEAERAHFAELRINGKSPDEAWNALSPSLIP